MLNWGGVNHQIGRLLVLVKHRGAECNFTNCYLCILRYQRGMRVCRSVKKAKFLWVWGYAMEDVSADEPHFWLPSNSLLHSNSFLCSAPRRVGSPSQTGPHAWFYEEALIQITNIVILFLDSWIQSCECQSVSPTWEKGIFEERLRNFPSKGWLWNVGTT